MKVALEEVVHYVTGATDNSRDFQDFLLDLAVKLGRGRERRSRGIPQRRDGKMGAMHGGFVVVKLLTRRYGYPSRAPRSDHLGERPAEHAGLVSPQGGCPEAGR